MTDSTSERDSTPEPGDDAPTFDAPWQARAFALAVTLTDERDDEAVSWDEFQRRLVAEVDADTAGTGAESNDRGSDDPEAVYYDQWLGALEGLLVDRGLLDPGDLAARVEAFEAGERDGHEFVEGNPHAHADRLPEGHADGSHHDHGH
ncbi:nitrile hydratase accessory protein [Halorussus litoreus]|uniref:nitrile hydratase accessory protein n=1 Tax=Halorussus litoreus TaxID=1710536 RepID=UPI000E26827A|nr:nitrile hydratase accessory protein [Halorussus litoreus]